MQILQRLFLVWFLPDIPSGALYKVIITMVAENLWHPAMIEYHELCVPI